MSDKTENATPYKLQKAKEKGLVNKSSELNVTLLLLCLLIITGALWPSLLKQIKALMIHLFSFAAQDSLQIQPIIQLQQFLLSMLISLWLPFALGSFFSLILSTIAQTGFVWSIKSLTPNIKRLNFIHGFKRLFSPKSLFEMVKSLLKLSLSFLLILFSFPREINSLLHLMTSVPNDHPQLIMHLILKLVLQLLLMLLVLALLDKLYIGWRYRKDNRMSKQEVKEEYRQREADPQIKSKIKKLQYQLGLKTTSLEQVKTADVLVTHLSLLAIALKYERDSMPAPKVVFKAREDLVTQAKKLAYRYSIPIIQDKSFAQSLFATVDLNQWIREEHFPIAARIFREAYRQRGLS